MRSNLKQSKQSIKLPSIGNRTLGDISRQQFKQKERPISSKNTVNDLEKRLFSQLDSYDKKSSTTKNSRKSINKKQQIAKPNNLISSMKQIKNIDSTFCNTGSDIFNGMQKIAQCTYFVLQQVMPQLMNKIKKYDQDNLPLKETYRAENMGSKTFQNTFMTEGKSADLNLVKPSNNLKSSKISTTSTVNNSQSIASKKLANSKPVKQQFSAETFAEQQINKIFKQYLEQQNMTDFPQMNDLKGMSQELNKYQHDIEGLQKSMANMIKQLGNICLNQFQDDTP